MWLYVFVSWQVRLIFDVSKLLLLLKGELLRLECIHLSLYVLFCIKNVHKYCKIHTYLHRHNTHTFQWNGRILKQRRQLISNFRANAKEMHMEAIKMQTPSQSQGTFKIGLFLQNCSFWYYLNINTYTRHVVMFIQFFLFSF